MGGEEGELDWEQFKDRVIVRFCPSAFDDYIGELTKLQQTSTVEDWLPDQIWDIAE